MIRALWTAGTGMNVQQVNLDIIANNIANVNTNGFKKSRADFQDLMYQTLRLQGIKTGEGNQVPTGIEIGHGAMLASVQKVFMQGDFQETQNELDLAIEGNGFLTVILPTGEKGYTRAGSLKRDSDGKIVTSDGYPLEPSITIPNNATSISIRPNGIVSAKIAGQSEPQQLGTIELTIFPNPSGLKAMGKSLYVETDASGSPITGKPGENGLGTLLQGFLEMSNVNVMQEMINLIVGQRAYEVNSKAIQAADEMLQMANNVRR
ncbi:MAG TPA: flagellar basal-body rod protein FlgG [Syntrophorhabdaceae bacterium]|nr:flagellar basal-body rod protein FlgG [Syntrophorhabdaceae bacterium]